MNEPAEPNELDDEPEADEPAPDERLATLRRRSMQFALVAIVIAVVAIVLLPKVPHAQRVRLHVGIGASNVMSVTARLGPPGATSDWDREATWRFPSGAPPSIVWETERTDGPCDVEVELSSATRTETSRTQIELKSSVAEPVTVSVRF
ncbi:MAG: hypothetical protein ACHREM_13825 [Polyangiales bacterium]